MLEPFDRACRQFRWYPAHAFEVQVCLRVDPITAHRIFTLGLRLSAHQRLIWLNDIAISLYSGVPLVIVQALMLHSLSADPVYTRGVE